MAAIARLAGLFLAFWYSGAIHAQVFNAFDPRVSFNERGDIAAIGNVLITCQPGGTPDCASVQNGTVSGNNNRATQYVNIDPGAGLTNTSSADLTMPIGAQVLFAGLYWGGRAATTSTTRGTISLRVPGATTYQTLTASVVDTITNAGTATTRPYEAFVDVTAQVQAAGNGSYFVGGLTATLGNDGLGYYGGWGLVVVYRDANQPFRRLMVFDGAAHVSGTTAVTAAVTGLLTPANGAFTTRIGAVVWEGDQGLSGDNFSLNGIQVGDVLNPANNFWNSSITRLGARIAAKNPDYVNQLALDIDYVDASGILPNSATTATLQFGTNGDTYFPHALFFVVDLFVPDLRTTLTKTANDINGAPLNPGDIVEYTIALSNSGQDGATLVVATDPIPAGMTYVANSLQILTNAVGAPTGAMTDAAGDDQANVVTGPAGVVFRLGQGADAVNGGFLPIMQGASVRFRVSVDSDSALSEQTLTNTVTLTNASQTLGSGFVQTNTASAALTVAPQADLRVTKTNTPGSNGDLDQPADVVVAGAATTYVLTVTNAGPAAAHGAVLTDPAPIGLTCANATCSASGGAVCPAATGAALLAAMQGAGVAIPTLPANGAVTIAVLCTVD
ncbi:MAG: DUF11 domain-containing protein [Lysobacteraceae bacterium]|nr:MAG: DUF11 domain-containing protein [Xanthomonadaceae bacterium]